MSSPPAAETSADVTSSCFDQTGSVPRLFSICKHCGIGNCKKVAVGSRGDCWQQGGPGMATIFGLGGPIILPWTVRGTAFEGGLSTVTV